jgi:uncharacterized protein YbjT (DUF2867 family)
MSTESKIAMVLGATGLVGKATVQQLFANPDYQKVVVITRRSLGFSHPKLDEHIIDFHALSDYSPLFNVHEVYCCLGTTMGKAGSQKEFYRIDHDLVVQSAKIAQMYARKFFLVSSIGANAWSMNFYLKVKGETERDVLQTTLESIYILRPSMLLGDRQENRIGERIGKVLLKVFTPLMFGGLRKYRGIHANTVAEAMLILAKKDQKGKYYFENNDIQNLVDQRVRSGAMIPQL